MINDTEYINILNENNNPVYTASMINPLGIKFDAAEDGIPSEMPITFAEFKFINKKTSAFKDGLLRVEPEKEDEILKAVGIYKKSNNFLTAEEITDIILNPTTEKLQRIISVTSPVTIEKIKGILFNLNSSDEYDIAIRVFEVVNTRYSELYNGRVNSSIVIKKRKNEVKEIETGVVEEEKKKAGRPKKTE